MTASAAHQPSSAGRGGLVARSPGATSRPAGFALLSVEPFQLLGVDQTHPVRADRRQRALLDVTPQHHAGHSDLTSCLGDGQQPSLLHAGKSSQPATLVTGYTRCMNPARIGILETEVTSKKGVMPRRGAAGFLESSAWLGVGHPTLKGTSEAELSPLPLIPTAMPPAGFGVHTH